MALLNIYGQAMEHMDAEIVANTEGLKVLLEAILTALAKGKGSTVNRAEGLYASDGEGYSVKILCCDEGWLSDFWKEHPPFYHHVSD